MDPTSQSLNVTIVFNLRMQARGCSLQLGKRVQGPGNHQAAAKLGQASVVPHQDMKGTAPCGQGEGARSSTAAVINRENEAEQKPGGFFFFFLKGKPGGF